MKEIQILGLLLLIVILILCFVKITQEGFAFDDDVKENNDFVKGQQQKFNNVATILAATTTNGTSNIGALGTESGNMMGSIQDDVDSSGKPIQYIDNPYPLEAKATGMAAIIEKCEAVKSTDCSAFDNAGYSGFSTNCGICLDVGTNSQDKPHTGALVLTSVDKQYAQSRRKGNFLAPYNPTVGTCPSGKMVATKAECLRLTAELACQRSASMDPTTGCSQCYTDGVYHIVPPSDTSLIVGSGILKVLGSGTLSWTEHFGTNANTGTATLSPNIFTTIPLSGPEYTKITLDVASRPVPTLYDPSITYKVNDLIVFTLNGTKGIFKMIRATGQPGYDPSNPVSGSKTWTLLTPFSTYVPPPPTFIAGLLESPNGNGFQPIDLYRLVMTDTVAGIGRKPRTMDQTSANSIDMTKMGPAYGKTAMSLSIYSPFTFIDSLSQEASLCPSSPYTTKPLSASFLNSDPCYTKGSGPGNYSLECLQQIFQNNGCGTSPGTLDKSGFPATNAKASGLMMNKDGKKLTIKEIADKIYQYAIASATGVDSTGKQLSISDWSDASMFCNGVAINSACDVRGDDGKLTDDCIVYLWDNQGENKIPGPTYSITSLARSLFSTGTTNRFCTRDGSLSPKDKLNNNKSTNNVLNLTYWKNRGDGSVAAVKAAMTQLHLDANSTTTNEAAKTPFIKQCYGIVPNDRNIYSGKFVSDTTVQSKLVPVLTRVNGNASWRAMASSADGSKIIGVEFGNIYRTTDKGQTWTTMSAAGSTTSYYSVSCSGDGTKVIISTYGGPVYLSTNSGSSWTTISTPGMSGNGTVACSADGSTMYAVFEGNGIYVSTNSGSTWTKASVPSLGQGWRGTACSSNGAIAVVVSHTMGVYTTSNRGTTWNKTSLADNNAWQAATCSANGTKMAVSSQHGKIFRLSNGVWQETSARPAPGYHSFMSVVASGDGNIILATSWSGGITVSLDSGTTWSSSSNNIKVHGQAAASSDGSFFIIGDQVGKTVHTYTPPAISPVRTGAGWSL